MDPDYFKSYEMCWGTLGTLRPFSNFHPERDAMVIKQALDKKDVGTLVRILTNRSYAQRQLISKTYEEITQKELEAGLRRALSGELETLILDLMTPPRQCDANRLQQAMAGLGTDEETLLEILCTRTREQLKEVDVVYRHNFKKELEKELKAETSGEFSKLLVALLNKENVAGVVLRDIESLLASLNLKKADAGPWIDILTSRDANHLDKVLMGVELENGQAVDQTLEKRFSGDIRLGLRTLVQCIQNPEVYLAKRISTMKTATVQGVMVSRCEEDLLCIRVAYLKQTGTSLYTALQKHYKGDHLQALLAICRSED